MNINININNVTVNIDAEQPVETLADTLTKYAKAHIRYKRRGKIRDIYERRRNDAEDAVEDLGMKILWEEINDRPCDGLKTRCKVWTIRRMVAERMLEEL